MDRLRQDVRFAFRGLRRSPGLFAGASLILALGIGMSVAVFTVFRTVLVRRLPVVDQDRVVVMWTHGENPNADLSTGTKDLSAVRRESKTMREIAAVAHWPASALPFRYGDRGIELNRGMSTGNFFQVLGVRPALGRLMNPDDDERPGEPPGDTITPRALVLSYRAWRKKFGGDSSVIGQRLVEPLVGIKYTIVGVAPPGFDYPAGVEYWIPMWQGWQSTVSAFAVARLAPGATVASARDEYLAIERRLQPTLPFRGAHAATFTETVLGDVRPVLRMLTAAVALLLVVACLNVGNLLLLRATSRAREIAVRRALGARYADVARQLFVEASLLAAIGGVLAFGVAHGSLRLLVALAPVNVPRLDDIELAGAPLAIAIAATTVAVLMFGVAPALLSARTDLASSLRADSRSGGETRRRRSVRQVLVASQIALAMVMLAGAALLVRSLERLERQDAGYSSDHLSVLWYSWNAWRDTTAAMMVALGDRLGDRIRAIPGVTAATPLVAPPLLGDGVWQIRYAREGDAEAAGTRGIALPTELPGPEFFETFGIRLLSGRSFTRADDDRSALVAIVSEAAARRLWPGEVAIGKRLRIPGANTSSIVGGDGWRTVVGIAGDANLRTARGASPMVYLPSRQGYWQGTFAIRSAVPLASLVSALRAAGHDVDPDVEFWNPRTMDEIVSESYAQPRLGTWLMSTFGLVALILSAIGLYGMMASLVREQMREIGIRIALGADSSRIRGDVLRRAGLIMAFGVASGLVGALVASRLLRSLLFQIAPTDPLALCGAAVVLLAVGAAAAYAPARRATQIDPMRVLRAD